jgi:hypothetical protein
MRLVIIPLSVGEVKRLGDIIRATQKASVVREDEDLPSHKLNP